MARKHAERPAARPARLPGLDRLARLPGLASLARLRGRLTTADPAASAKPAATGKPAATAKPATAATGKPAATAKPASTRRQVGVSRRPAAGGRQEGTSTARSRQRGGGAARPAARSAGAGRVAAAPGRLPRGAPGWLAGLASAAGWRLWAVARAETAARLGRLAAITVALAVLVAVLYEHGDVPTAAARPAADPRTAAHGWTEGRPGGPAAPGRTGGGPGTAAAPGAETGTGAAAAPGRGEAHRGGGPAAGGGAIGERPAQRAAKPADVAAAWYAARHRLPARRVRPLQQDRLSARRVRVLVLADAGNGHLRTALVEVRLGPSGWEVR